MSTWKRFSSDDGWDYRCYARRTDRKLTADEKARGLQELVEARSYVQLADRVDEQDALERELAEGAE